MHKLLGRQMKSMPIDVWWPRAKLLWMTNEWVRQPNAKHKMDMDQMNKYIYIL